MAPPLSRPKGPAEPGVEDLDAARAILDRPKGSVEPLLSLTHGDLAGVDDLITLRMCSEVPVIPALAQHLVNAGGKRLH